MATNNPPRRSSPATYALAVSAMIVLTMIGLSRIYDPFSGDQALFLLGASALKNGSVLYRDFWDLKQPGIFMFYLLAGNGFGFSQIGAHLADVVWQLCFALTVVIAMRNQFRNNRTLVAVPLVVVAPLWMGSSHYHLIQVESLCGFPLFAFAWAVMAAMQKGDPSARRVALLAGVIAGLVVMLKSLFAISIIAIAIAVASDSRATRERRTLVTGFLSLGVAVPLALYGVVALVQHASGQLLEAALLDPLQIARTIPHASPQRLGDSALRFVLYFRGILLLAAIGCMRDDRADRSAWQRVAYAWVLSGIATIAIQMQSWWQYQFLLILPPLGILAALGIDRLVDRLKDGGSRRYATLAVCGCIAYVGFALPQAAVAAATAVVRERPYASQPALLRYREAHDPEYRRAVEDSVAVRLGPDDTMYVFGDPLIYLLMNKQQPIAMNGWALQLYTPQMWSRLDEQLRAVRPKYVFVLNVFAGGLIANRTPATARMLSQDYRIERGTADGTWLVRRTYRQASTIKHSALTPAPI